MFGAQAAENAEPAPAKLLNVNPTACSPDVTSCNSEVPVDVETSCILFVA